MTDYIDKRCTDFRPKMLQKRLAAGLRPDPLGSLQHSPDPGMYLRRTDSDKRRERGKTGEGVRGGRGEGKEGGTRGVGGK